jgi:hypothetical protein
MWQQWFRLPSLRCSTGDQVTVLKFYAEARKDMAGAERRAELMDWFDKSTQPGFASILAADAGTALRCEAIRLSLDLDAVSDEVADARTSLELLQAEFGAVQAEFGAVQAEFGAVQAEFNVVQVELMAARDASGTHAAEAEDARTTARGLQVALDAVRGTRTWRLHDWLARSSAFRWLAHR